MRARRDDARVGPRAESTTTTTYSIIVTQVLAEVKRRAMVGEVVAAIDFPPKQREAFWIAIQIARDELPNLSPRWRTIREYHGNGRRVLELTYRLKQSGQADPLLPGWLCVTAAWQGLAVRGVLV